MIKGLIATISFYFLALLQTSFLPQFEIFGLTLNIIILSVAAIALLEPTQNIFGIYCAFVGGFFLDIFSSRPFGLWIIILLLCVLVIKLIVKRYVRIPACQNS